MYLNFFNSFFNVNSDYWKYTIANVTTNTYQPINGLIQISSSVTGRECDGGRVDDTSCRSYQMTPNPCDHKRDLRISFKMNTYNFRYLLTYHSDGALMDDTRVDRSSLSLDRVAVDSGYLIKKEFFFECAYF
ncbi:hypothetical protein TNCV_2655701 [Trichonephila clavipes]|nr:hypothetical protein TNCV_2655701 [Trichonephila clavipes]